MSVSKGAFASLYGDDVSFDWAFTVSIDSNIDMQEKCNIFFYTTMKAIMPPLLIDIYIDMKEKP